MFNTKKGKSKDQVRKIFTGNLLSTKRESWNANKRNYTGNSSDEEEEKEGGTESDSEEESDAGSYANDSDEELTKSYSVEAEEGKERDEIEIIHSKFERKITNALGNKRDEPIDTLEKIWSSLVDYSKNLDLQLQEKISNEINKGKVEIKAKEYIKDSTIYNKTNFDARPSSAKRKSEANNENKDLPQDREFIAFGHEKFDLVFNIMLGIKRSVDCVFHSPFSQIRKSDYKAQYEYKNEWYSAKEDSANLFIFL